MNNDVNLLDHGLVLTEYLESIICGIVVTYVSTLTVILCSTGEK